MHFAGAHTSLLSTLADQYEATRRIPRRRIWRSDALLTPHRGHVEAQSS